MDLQKSIKQILHAAAEAARAAGEIQGEIPEVVLQRPRRPEHGDFACNLAMVVAKASRRPPRDVAAALVAHIQDPQGLIAETEIAGPGFLNLRLAQAVWHGVLGDILAAGPAYGQGAPRGGPRVLIEFVSANPTGPLHVGHGRGAVAGDALARLLRMAGHDVTTEYYLNDAGSQVEKLARSVQARALALLGEADPNLPVVPFPEDGYPGDYVIDVARAWLAERGEMPAGPMGESLGGEVADFAVARLREEIAATLGRMHIHFDIWSSEKALHRAGAVSGAISDLVARGHVRKEEGALWFASSAFGDEKDRVVVRESGEPTYFAADIAYHRDKYQRGFDHLINIWGADHHGYIARMKGAAAALGRDPSSLEILLVQFVALVRGGQKVQQGKRLGQFVTVDEVLDEVGPDVARYFFLERKLDSQVDFDLEVALSEDPRVNPAKYAQYGHARACSILAKAESELGMSVPPFDGQLASRLVHPDEIAILKHLSELPLLVEEAAQAREPHRVVAYLQELSRAFQSYYTRLRREADPVLPPADARGEGWEKRWDVEKMRARLLWVEAIRIVSGNALSLLGLEAPSRMDRIEDIEPQGEDHA